MHSRPALLLVVALVSSAASGACGAKAAPLTALAVCGSSFAIPNILPPAGSGPVVLMAAPCLDPKDGGTPAIPAAYRRYVQLQPSRPSDGVWIPFDDRARQMIDADYRRLWDAGGLSDLAISVTDYLFSNGVVGKIVVYTIREDSSIR
jgi:hypothetical protein